MYGLPNPRLRGGTIKRGPRDRRAPGLSPPARGNLSSTLLPNWTVGPIPACAGEPRRQIEAVRRARAYPRLRGGTTANARDRVVETGLFPPARGNQHDPCARIRGGGPIPACAGEPSLAAVSQRENRAYPRLRGGTRGQIRRRRACRGLSPPPARGNPPRQLPYRELSGPIPACAGEPDGRLSAAQGLGAYPRLRGGTS